MVTSLQWGRDLTVADIHDETAQVLRGYLLQWGRDLTVADMPLTSPAVDMETRFNGAAT